MQIKIGNKKVGENCPIFIIAELGINHNGKVKIAQKMILEATKAGADAVKLQSFVVDDFVGDKNLKFTYTSQGKRVTETQYVMFKRYELSKKMQKELFDFAREIGIIIFSTPQDNSFQTVDYLCGKEINMPVIKVGSDDLTNLPMLAHYAKKGKPMIVSTGLATMEEIRDAVRIINEQGNKELILLKCTGIYPAPPQEANLAQIKTLEKTFHKIVGFSDHTIGPTAAVAATILGARVIEKHFTLDKNLPGPDHWFSADPEEFSQMVGQVREAEKMLGKPDFILSEAEKKNKLTARRSLMVEKPIKKGEIIKKEQIVFKRPGSGLPIKFLAKIVGKVAKNNFPKGYIFTKKDL